MLSFLLTISIFLPFTIQSCINESFWSDELGTCVLPVEIATSSISAELNCQSLGGHLFSIHNAFENAAVADLHTKKLTGQLGWIGGWFNSSVPTWLWYDETPFNYQHWVASTEKGGCLYMDPRNNHDWRQIDCSGTFQYLCDLPPTTLTTPST
ncbi:unnamed protein product, partial [Mesorhabditis belari]|uniref:C-type lectin domain-containing protein n=1 Tax=Mesorhabditis belari TaxID=2138241 RepID=A0AAF3J961_9BILA